MEVKKYGQLNEEIHPNDEQTIKLLVNAIQKLMKSSIEVRLQGFEGIVLIDGLVAFTTSGNSTVAVISGYLSGMFKGLMAEKN